MTLPNDSADRKTYPMYKGLFEYFPAALAAVANVSYVGNQQHNPGEELFDNREKSNDDYDCLLRHLTDAELDDDDGLLHAAKVAWRALRACQKILEERGAPRARAARWPGGGHINHEDHEEYDWSNEPDDDRPFGNGREAVAKLMQTDDQGRDTVMVPVIHSIGSEPHSMPDADADWERHQQGVVQECPNHIHERIAGDTPQARALKNIYYRGTPFMAGTPVLCDDGYTGVVEVSPDSRGFTLVEWLKGSEGELLLAPAFFTTVHEDRLEVL